jgi:hypothetical protein
MIWGGQALRIFDDRLSASLSQIRNAKEALDHNIKQDEGQQHIKLVQEYMTILEGFEKHFSALSNVQVRIQLKIKHVIGLRDGVGLPHCYSIHIVNSQAFLLENANGA